MKQILFFSFILFLLSHCANIGQPDGGARDTTPPKVDSLRSTPMLQTDFHPDQTKRSIELYFNEWIKVENAQKQIVVSPPLQYSPTIVPKGKGVTITLDPREKLLANTTYTINFGEAIKDLTESNEVKNLRYVFSTGPIIDSGQISGKVFNAQTKETKEDFLVMLYTTDSDTAVYKTKPVYFSRTDKEGNFTIANIKDTSYRIFVLNDANSNYLYDQDKEEIGYLDRWIDEGEDSTTITIPYYISQVRPRITAFNFDKAGVVKIQSNLPLNDLRSVSLNDSISISTLISKDTFFVFYDPPSARNWSLEISNPEKIMDTISVNRVRFNQPDSLKANPEYKEIKTLSPNTIREIEFNSPIRMIDTSLVQSFDDTTNQIIKMTSSLGPESQKVNFLCPCTEGHSYSLIILPGAIVNYAGQKNADTIKVKLRGLQKEQGGSMILTIDNLDSVRIFQINLLSESKLVKKEVITGKKSVTLTFAPLMPAGYEIRIWQDDNDNGIWDAGNYRTKKQPEKLQIQSNFNVRSNWELREQIIWKP